MCKSTEGKCEVFSLFFLLLTPFPKRAWYSVIQTRSSKETGPAIKTAKKKKKKKKKKK